MNNKEKQLINIIRKISRKNEISRASILLDMLLNHDLSVEYRGEIQEWFQSEVNTKAKYEVLESFFLIPGVENITEEYLAANFTKLRKMIADREQLRIQGVDLDSGYNEYDIYLENIQTEHNADTNPNRRRRGVATDSRSRGRSMSFGRLAMRVAAVVVPLMIVGGVWLWSDRKIAQNETTTLVAEIYPTTNITVTGNAGTLKTVDLPDGSQVWINSEGTVSYNDDFSQERFVTVDGEVYFSVAKDSLRPFRVKTRDMLVEVLGTEFNLKARNENTISEIVLVSGAVEVTTSSKDKYNITPGQRLSIDNTTRTVVIDNISQDQVVSQWRKQNYAFSETPLGQVLQWIGSYHNKEVILNDLVPVDEIVSLDLDQNMTLEQMMEVICLITDIQYKIEDQSILITTK